MYDNNALTVVKGSLQEVAEGKDQSLAETFLSAETVIICDVSGSMAARDSRGGKSRYEVELEELARLQATLPGKIAVLAFSDETIFCPGGQPPMLGSGTDLAGALRFAQIADGTGMRFIIIGDGEPNDEADALAVAAQYVDQIDCIYVGPEDYPTGRLFLEKLARRRGGQTVTADRAKELAPAIQYLLGAW